MVDHAVSGIDFFEINLPLVCGGLQQYGSGSRAGHAHRNLARCANRRTATGQLQCHHLGRTEKQPVDGVDEPGREIDVAD